MSTQHILQQPHAGVACSLCGKHLGLYFVRNERHSLCAPCTRERIETWAPQPEERPTWVATLYDEVAHEIRYREQQERRSYTVSWDLVKCSACGRMMKRGDARYDFPDADEAEHAPERILAPARQLRDGTVLVFPLDGVPEIYPPVCVPCYQVVR